MKQYKLDGGQPIQADYPQCELCYAPLRRPCTLAWRKDDRTVDYKIVCRGCYKIGMILGRMVEYGFIGIVESECCKKEAEK